MPSKGAWRLGDQESIISKVDHLTLGQLVKKRKKKIKYFQAIRTNSGTLPDT